MENLKPKIYKKIYNISVTGLWTTKHRPRQETIYFIHKNSPDTVVALMYRVVRMHKETEHGFKYIQVGLACPCDLIVGCIGKYRIMDSA